VIDDPDALPEPQTRDPQDEFLIALARSARVPALISGDDHLTSLEDPRPPVIMPAACLRRLT
jgi:predicted nucleic acid-binding protein